MKILARDLRHGALRLLPENLDDLWVLYNVIQPGDYVKARTTREMSVEGARRKRSRRVSAVLGLEVKRVTWDRVLNRLRVLGVVREAPEELEALGKHHTIDVAVGSPVLVRKAEWPSHMLEQIKRACQVKEKPVVLISIDDEEYCIAVLRHRGPRIRAEARTRLPGKLEVERREASLNAFLAESVKALREVWNETRGPIIILGPGFMKKRLHKYIMERHPDLAESVSAVRGVSSGGAAGIYEALRSGVLEKTIEGLRAVEESEAIGELLARIGRGDGRAVYGVDAVRQANIHGAVELLLVSDSKLKEADVEGRKALEELVRDVEARGGRVMIVSSEHEAGRNLQSLGGVAALLRFPLNDAITSKS